MQRNTEDLAPVIARLEQVERANRLLRRGFLTLLLLVGSAAVLALTYPRSSTIRAQRVILVDPSGQEHGAVEAAPGALSLQVRSTAPTQLAPGQAPVQGIAGGPVELMVTEGGELILMQGRREIFRFGGSGARRVD
jgi:hypothetical protein